MSCSAANTQWGLSEGANLALFPVDQDALLRLAQAVTPEELRESRLTTISTLMALLKPLLEEIDRMESIVRIVDPTLPELIRAIVKMHRAAEQCYSC